VEERDGDGSCWEYVGKEEREFEEDLDRRKRVWLSDWGKE